MSETSNLQMVSTLGADGRLIVELVEKELPAPSGTQVLIRVEAAPINPSDLGLLFGPADVENAEFSGGRIVARMPAAAVQAMAGRIGAAMPVGNEGAGTVVAAGTASEAQALLGKLVSCAAGGGMYAQYCLVDARQCLTLPQGIGAEQGASSFVNPMTALGFVETVRREGQNALVHTAAASNLGQMLVKICQEDGISLVNIVRSDAQSRLLKGVGAKHVVDSSKESFDADLAAALEATGAMIVFDAIGGGTLVSQILHAMERIAGRGMPYSRYGSNKLKRAYIYGSLDTAPTVISRTGYSWNVGGWLVTPFLQTLGADRVEQLRQRVRDNLTTTFASHYSARVSLQDALTREAVLTYNARRTGEKYLITP